MLGVHFPFVTWWINVIIDLGIVDVITASRFVPYHFKYEYKAHTAPDSGRACVVGSPSIAM